MTMIYRVTAAVIVVGLMAGTANAQYKSVIGKHEDGWILKLTCPTTVKEGQTCKMQAWLDHKATKKLKSNKVAKGSIATVELTIADKDTFSKDDVILTKTFKFNEGERIRFKEMLCGNLKKDIGKKSEIYAKVRIRTSLKAINTTIIGYKAKIKTPTIKVKTVK